MARARKRHHKKHHRKHAKRHSASYFYGKRARAHEKAARNSSGRKKEGHLEVARGYHKLARR
jgi:hypothetical protein